MIKNVKIAYKKLVKCRKIMQVYKSDFWVLTNRSCCDIIIKLSFRERIKRSLNLAARTTLHKNFTNNIQKVH